MEFQTPGSEPTDGGSLFPSLSLNFFFSLTFMQRNKQEMFLKENLLANQLFELQGIQCSLNSMFIRETINQTIYGHSLDELAE